MIHNTGCRFPPSRRPTTSLRTRGSTSAMVWWRRRRRTSSCVDAAAMQRGLRALGLALALGLVLIVGLVPSAQAHDPFEITTDAHVSGDGLGVHTTQSLSTAGRACLNGADAERRLEPADFDVYRSRFEACARDYYHVA